MLNLALISGGTSAEREVSLRSGDSVLQYLDKKKYHITRYDPAADLEKLVHDKNNIDFALIMLHGRGGEDGQMQGFLELLGIPYNGSHVRASANAMHKPTAKMIYRLHGLPVAKDILLSKDETYDIPTIIAELGLPIVVKPVNEGSSKGMSIPKTKEDLEKSIQHGFEFDDQVLLEEFIKGTEVTASILGNEHPIALPLIEIVPSQEYEFFDYEAKYKPNATDEICPARLSESLTKKCQDLGIRAHQALGCLGVSRTDMIIREKNIYILETNTLPGMTAGSLLPKAAKTYGMSFSVFLDRLIELGLEAHKKLRA